MKNFRFGFFVVATSLFQTVFPAEPLSDTSAVHATITVDAAQPVGELKPIWRFFGADEPNYAYMKDGQKLLGELGQLGTPQVYFRTHHLLTAAAARMR